MRLVALLTAFLVTASSAAFKLSAGVAPAIVGGDVDPALAPWTGRPVAEMLSWEISMVQTIRVIDPATLTQAERLQWVVNVTDNEWKVGDARPN